MILITRQTCRWWIVQYQTEWFRHSTRLPNNKTGKCERARASQQTLCVFFKCQQISNCSSGYISLEPRFDHLVAFLLLFFFLASSPRRGFDFERFKPNISPPLLRCQTDVTRPKHKAPKASAANSEKMLDKKTDQNKTTTAKKTTTPKHCHGNHYSRHRWYLSRLQLFCFEKWCGLEKKEQRQRWQPKKRFFCCCFCFREFWLN